MLCVCTCLWRCKRLRFWNPKIISDYIYFDESSAKSENGRHTFSQLAVITFNYFHHRLCLVRRPQASVHSAQAAYHNRLTIVRLNSCKGTDAGHTFRLNAERKKFRIFVWYLYFVCCAVANGYWQRATAFRSAFSSSSFDYNSVFILFSVFRTFASFARTRTHNFVCGLSLIVWCAFSVAVWEREYEVQIWKMIIG